jgi:hypothetical protein
MIFKILGSNYNWIFVATKMVGQIEGFKKIRTMFGSPLKPAKEDKALVAHD